MAKTELVASINAVHGKMAKSGREVMRQKKYRAPNGAVLKEGVQESYTILHPRDFDKTPPQGAELANMRSFGDISLLASEIIRSGKYTDDELAAMTDEQRARVAELRPLLEDFRKRFYAQFKRPDPEAPFEKKPRPGSAILLRKQYSKLDNFIQAVIRERCRNSSANMAE